MVRANEARAGSGMGQHTSALRDQGLRSGELRMDQGQEDGWMDKRTQAISMSKLCVKFRVENGVYALVPLVDRTVINENGLDLYRAQEPKITGRSVVDIESYRRFF